MLELDEYKLELQKYKKPLEEVRDSLDIEAKENRIAELEKAMEASDFWDDVENSGKVMKEIKGLKSTIENYNGMKKGDNIIIPAGSKVLKTPDVGNEFTFKLPNGAVLTIDVDNLEDYVD